MKTFFTLKLSKADRDALVRATEAMAQEYRHVADQVLSQYLADGFRGDAVVYDNLAHALKSLADREAINEMIRRELALGNKINAIKGVRAATLMGLKEAKEYVDNFTTAPDYGVGII